MRVIPWIDIFERLGIEYQEGPSRNVRSGHVGVHCPMCHDDDKFHFSLDLNTGKVRGCWRDASHWLKPVDLLSDLARIPREHAYELIKGNSNDVKLATLIDILEPSARNKIAPMPTEWFKEAEVFGSSKRPVMPQEPPYWNYLKKRGYDPRDLSEWYGMRWCATGKRQGRVYFPIHYRGKMVGYTGRAVTKNARAKYLTKPSGETMRQCVWNDCVDEGVRADLLVINEGPFDGLRVDMALDGLGWAVAALSVNVGEDRVNTILRIREELDADRMVIMLDHGTEALGMALQDRFGVDRPDLCMIPEQFKDPDEMTTEQILDTLEPWL